MRRCRHHLVCCGGDLPLLDCQSSDTRAAPLRQVSLRMAQPRALHTSADFRSRGRIAATEWPQTPAPSRRSFDSPPLTHEASADCGHQEALAHRSRGPSRTTTGLESGRRFAGPIGVSTRRSQASVRLLRRSPPSGWRRVSRQAPLLIEILLRALAETLGRVSAE